LLSGKLALLMTKGSHKMRSLAILPGFLLISSALLAQNPAPPQPKPPEGTQQSNSPAKGLQTPGTIRTVTKEVIVPVTVKDKSGNLVADLKKEDFRIFEDNVEQQITNIKTNAIPISMVILVDNDLKKKDSQQVEPSLISLVGGMSDADEAFVCRFDQYFHEGKGFTKDQDQLITQLRRTELSSRPSAPPAGDPFGGPTINGAPAPGAPQTDPQSMIAIKGQPTKALDDAVYSAASLLQARDPNKRRKIILLISDGQNGPKFNTHKYEEVRAELFRQGIAVYSVATGSVYFERKFNRLLSYAHDTGGDIYYGAQQSTFSEFYSRITEEARNQYILAYSPAAQDEKKTDYHSIEVRVKRPDLEILARKGYYTGEGQK
jgi:VWFA-related protein